MKLNSKAILRVPRENYTTKLTAETQGNKSHLFQVHEQTLERASKPPSGMRGDTEKKAIPELHQFLQY